MRNRAVRYAGLLVFLLIAAWAIELGIAVTKAENTTNVEHASNLHLAMIAGPHELRHALPFGQDFDVTSSGSVLLEGEHRLLELSSDGKIADLALHTVPDSVALDRSDNLLAVTNGFLGVVSAGDPDAQAGVPLPYQNARVASSTHPGAVYMFGGGGRDYRLYRFLEDGTYQILLSSDEPIVAATDNVQGVYAATSRSVFRLGWPKPTILFRSPNDGSVGPITSIAAAEDGLLFFSTPARIFALKGGIAVSVVNDSGGMLRLQGKTLYVLDPNRQLLYTLDPASLDMFGNPHP